MACVWRARVEVWVTGSHFWATRVEMVPGGAGPSARLPVPTRCAARRSLLARAAADACRRRLARAPCRPVRKATAGVPTWPPGLAPKLAPLPVGGGSISRRRGARGVGMANACGASLQRRAASSSARGGEAFEEVQLCVAQCRHEIDGLPALLCKLLQPLHRAARTEHARALGNAHLADEQQAQ